MTVYTLVLLCFKIFCINRPFWHAILLLFFTLQGLLTGLLEVGWLSWMKIAVSFYRNYMSHFKMSCLNAVKGGMELRWFLKD